QDLVTHYGRAAGGRVTLPATELGRQSTSRRSPDCRYVLVGTSTNFDVPALARFGSTITVPWSIIVADDLPSLSFQLAKSLISLGIRSPASSLAVDAISNEMSMFGSNGSVLERRQYNHPELGNFLEHEDWADVAINAHGRGGHTNLGAAVLCGLPG